MPNEYPRISIQESDLDNSGFVTSGKLRFIKTIKEYAELLYDKTINYGEIDRASNSPREVTHEHVRSAAYSIANSYGKPQKSNWILVAKIGQYLCAAFVGLSTAYLDKTIGLIGFVVSFSVGATLLIIEKSKNK